MVNEKQELLKILIEDKDKKFSIRKLSLIRKINYKSAYLAIKKLEEVKRENLGNTTLCSFKNILTPLTFQVEFERRQKTLKNKDLNIIYSRLKELNFPFIALLFGSQLKNPTKHSDIDILIITENKEINQTLQLIPLNIHQTIISYKEFIQMTKSKEFSVVSEANKKNIILIGIESYYQLLENAK
tara:strand:- start:166 stop:720 length:555 start_codon:yes stop_codon:yes gene_type:complete